MGISEANPALGADTLHLPQLVCATNLEDATAAVIELSRPVPGFHYPVKTKFTDRLAGRFFRDTTIQGATRQEARKKRILCAVASAPALLSDPSAKLLLTTVAEVPNPETHEAGRRERRSGTLATEEDQPVVLLDGGYFSSGVSVGSLGSTSSGALSIASSAHARQQVEKRVAWQQAHINHLQEQLKRAAQQKVAADARKAELVAEQNQKAVKIQSQFRRVKASRLVFNLARQKAIEESLVPDLVLTAAAKQAKAAVSIQRVMRGSIVRSAFKETLQLNYQKTLALRNMHRIAGMEMTAVKLLAAKRKAGTTVRFNYERKLANAATKIQAMARSASVRLWIRPLRSVLAITLASLDHVGHLLASPLVFISVKVSHGLVESLGTSLAAVVGSLMQPGLVPRYPTVVNNAYREMTAMDEIMPQLRTLVRGTNSIKIITALAKELKVVELHLQKIQDLLRNGVGEGDISMLRKRSTAFPNQGRVRAQSPSGPRIFSRTPTTSRQGSTYGEENTIRSLTGAVVSPRDFKRDGHSNSVVMDANSSASIRSMLKKSQTSRAVELSGSPRSSSVFLTQAAVSTRDVTEAELLGPITVKLEMMQP